MNLPAGSNYVNGSFVVGDGPEVAVVNPANGETLWAYASASPEAVAQAVEAATRAYPGWSGVTPAARSTLLLELARCLESISEELAQAETAQAGKPIRLCRAFDVPGSIDNTYFFAGAARRLDGLASGEYSGDHTSTIRRESLGVIGSIAPWNYPLQMAMWKVLPAIAAGNTIVIKPAEITPITTLMLAEAATRAGIPDGVVNVVSGPGASVGESLVSDARIVMTSFTGSTAVGRHIAAVAAGNGTRVHLELGGKAPFVVFDDADLDAAIRGAVAGALINNGQDCTAATRAYVHRSLFNDFVTGVAALMQTVVLGDPTDPATDQGPLVSFQQRDRVAAMVDRALAVGARTVTGGKRPLGMLAKGAYYEPTLLVDVDQRSEIVQSEVFGPVLVALPFDTDEEGLRLANDVPFGLAASAWTTDVFRAQTAARLLKAGTVWINDHIPIISEMPHGGMKGSGYGKDMSMFSFDEYTQIKHVMADITGVAAKTWHNTVIGAGRTS